MLKCYLPRFRIQALEAALQDKEQQLRKETTKFVKLKEDFKYNLKLLEERDQELERYDLTFTGQCKLRVKYHVHLT